MKAGGRVRVQDSVCLLREGRIQSVRARMDRLCSGQDIDFKEVQRSCTVIQFGRGKKQIAYSVSVALRASISGVSTGSIQCKVYPGAYSVSEAKEKNRMSSRVDIEVQRFTSGESSVALES